MTAPGCVKINNISLDSRKIERGDLFVAVKGAGSHGAQYIDSAIQNGASAILVDSSAGVNESRYSVPVIKLNNLKHRLAKLADRLYADPSAKLTLIAVTGTNGKTTCAHLIAQALNQLSVSSAIIGTAGAGLLDDLSLSSLTTPDVFEFRRLLAKFEDKGVKAVVFEASSHGLQQGRLDELKIDLAVFTNLSHDHLDYHGDLSGYSKAKLKLFQFPCLRKAVMNADRPLLDDFKSQTTAREIWFYGESQTADVRLVTSRSLPDGLHISLATSQGEFQFRSSLVGRINVENLLAVFTTLMAFGFDASAIVRVMPNLVSVPGRMEVFGGRDALPMVIVDYAHTPDALEKALHSIRDHLQGRLYCVFGCGGDRDREKRPKMGKAAQENADVCVVTDDNPRHENPADIIADIVSGMSPDARVISDRPQAIKWAIEQACEKDIVLVAGKGHEGTQQVGDRFIPMSDRDLVNECLGALR